MSRFGDDERNSRKQMLSTLGGMASGAFLLFLIFFIIFAQSLKATPDYVPQADAIVVFTGTSPVRIETGLQLLACLLYTSPSPRDRSLSRMPSSA